MAADITYEGSELNTTPDPEASIVVDAVYLERHGNPPHVFVPAENYEDKLVPLCNGPNRLGGMKTARLIPLKKLFKLAESPSQGPCQNCLRSIKAQNEHSQ